MAGIYLHIPFCKQACHYCNFHFSTSLRKKTEMVGALLREIDLRNGYLSDRELKSIYLGGGTPSLLTLSELDQLFERMGRYFTIHPEAEITLEANPDDLSKEYLSELAQSPVNRLSIGVQSFFAEDLVFMNRAHTADEADRCIRLAQDAGFDNLSIDLIYGSPTTPLANWIKNLEQSIALEVPHLSTYALTVEPQTALAHFVAKGKVPAPKDAQMEEQFYEMLDRLERADFEHYEISNWAKPGHYAVHNTSYWQGVPYLGIGPSAHSYDGRSRQWNIANNARYMADLAENQVPAEREEIDPVTAYNEYVLTRMRTQWGCELANINPAYQAHFLQNLQPFLKRGEVLEGPDQTYRLSRSGKLLADHIASELFFLENEE
ncbi:MAG: radical SAM family heme chaperone HemW [Bacteroidota bacterium]